MSNSDYNKLGKSGLCIFAVLFRSAETLKVANLHFKHSLIDSHSEYVNMFDTGTIFRDSAKSTSF